MCVVGVERPRDPLNSAGQAHQTAFIECFTRIHREGVLDAGLFECLDEVRRITNELMKSLYDRRPHDAMGGMPPVDYREKSTVGNSTSDLSH